MDEKLGLAQSLFQLDWNKMMVFFLKSTQSIWIAIYIKGKGRACLLLSCFLADTEVKHPLKLSFKALF